MSQYELDYPDYTQSPDYEPGDEIPSNHSSNPNFYDVIDARTSRRGFMVGGLATICTGLFGSTLNSTSVIAQTAATSSLLGFKAIPTSEADTIVVPEGYKARVLIPWGTPLDGTTGFSQEATGEEQASLIGSHHDGMHFFAIDGSSADGLLVLNHEYVDPRFLHASYKGKAVGEDDVIVENDKRNADEVLKEMNAHGISVVRVQRSSDGSWKTVADERNRRITALTEIEIAGPARGSDLLMTKYSPDGTKVRGTLNNCAHGVTPWNTYMAAEENWAGYFRNTDQEDQKENLPREHKRYGVKTQRGRYAWDLAEGGADAYIRFDASRKGNSASEDYRNEPNAFGWMVEIDPFDPNAKPVKRTHLGRFAHEGVVFAPAEAGKPVVCYSGDDARFEYIYKFVSAKPFTEGTDGSILDEGTLYAAKFNDDGTGEWLPLKPGENGLTPENGFADLAEILVNTRLAADMAGATKMDRPEWGTVDPNSGEVYFTLTNNTRRTQVQVDAVNPRARNAFGQIVRWREADGNHAATHFAWDLFVISGDAKNSKLFNGKALGDENIFACPDGIWCDADSRLWIQTDISESVQNQGSYAVFGNNQMLAADPKTGEIRRFLTGPKGQEITGVITTPDQTTMFINVQHPGAPTTKEDFAAGNLLSHWPDGGDAVPRSATVVITREDGGKIGT